MAKKIILALVMVLVITTTGCSKQNTTKEEATKEIETIELTEEMFINWVNEIDTNPDSYIGYRLTLEGLYLPEGHESIKNTYGYVYRRGLGCCTTDGGVFGFEFNYDELELEDGSWIEVTGILSTYEKDGKTKLVIQAESVTVKEEYGTVFLSS